MTQTTMSPWWRSAVIYQVYPRSFSDSDGNGIGDLPGITARLDHLARLGVDAIWLSPFFLSPQRDAGYDVADYCDVEPLFGTLDDADALIARAHALGMRVIIDIVPNHTSVEHAWFQEALAAGPDSPERDRYIFRHGRGIDGEVPPNNWLSLFGGPAWTRITEADGSPGPWYLHLFDSSQPDLDWTNPWVADRFDEILRFWLDRGVDGFRVDVANGLAKDMTLPDLRQDELGAPTEEALEDHPFWAREEVHEIWRRWRHIVDGYPGERVLVGEVWVLPLARMAKWTRADEFHQTFNFAYCVTPWDAEALRDVVDESIIAFAGVGAPATWVLSNHDMVRHTTRLAQTTHIPHGVGIGPDTPDHPDEELGLARGRAATLFTLALPGSVYLYQGEELGLPEAIDLPDDARQDPSWFRTGDGFYGRDGCRVPLPWEADEPSFGFSPTGASWLPQPANWGRYAASAQDRVEGSTLEMYREALRLRRIHGLGLTQLLWSPAPAGVLDATVGKVRALINLGTTPHPLPAGQVMLASQAVAGELPPNAAAWILQDGGHDAHA